MPNIQRIENVMDQRDILRIITEFTQHPGDALTSCTIEMCSTLLSYIYECLLHFLPNVPDDLTKAFVKSTTETNADCEKNESLNLPDVNIYALECLLYSLWNLIDYCPTFLGFGEVVENKSNEGACRLSMLRQKVQYVARLIQSYRSQLVTHLEQKFREDKMPQNKRTSQVKKVCFICFFVLLLCFFLFKICVC